MSIYKGTCLNDPDPVKARALGLQWARGSFNVLPDADYGGMKVCFDCTDDTVQSLLTPDNIRAVKSRSYYEGLFIVGYNEPDLNNITPEAYVERAAQQATIILQGDADAEFVVWGGTQAHPLYNTDEWFWRMWKVLPGDLRERVRAICTDYYVQAAFPNDPSQWLYYRPLYDYLKQCRTALSTYRKGHLANRELWCVEVGLVNQPYVLANPHEAAFYVDTALHVAREFCARVAWYLEKQREDNYLSLYDPQGNLTLAGEVFRGI